MSNLKAVPQVKGQFLLGNFQQIKTNPFQTICDWQREYGDLVGFRLATRQFYLISHPQLVEQALIKQSDVFVKMYNPDKPKGLALVLGQGLITSQGSLWQQQRRLIQPVFQRSNLSALLPQILTAGHQMLERWQQLGDGATIDISAEMMRLTLEVITQTMFGTSVLDQVERLAPALDIVLHYAARSVINPIAIPLPIPTAENQAFKQAMAVLDEVIYSIIEQRRTHPNGEQDLLSMLLAARDETGGNAMSDRQIRDEVITVFSAGHETTANLLSWTLYLLAKHPSVLSRLRQEIATLPTTQTPDAASLQALTYTKAVLNESLRIRPPAAIMIRKITQDTQLNGYRLKAGSLALFSLYNIHHHPGFWPQAEQFDPERFLGAESRRFSFMPFGTGERVCIGNHFAMLESQLLLSMIVQRYDIELINAADAEVEMVISLRPKGGLPARIRERS